MELNFSSAKGDDPRSGEVSSKNVVDGRSLQPNFGRFKKYLLDSFAKSDMERQELSKGRIADLYNFAAILGMSEEDYVKVVAEYLHLPYTVSGDYEKSLPQLLPIDFCRWNLVAPIIDADGNNAFLLSNPFDWELLDVLRRETPTDQAVRLIVATPSLIRKLLEQKTEQTPKGMPSGEQTTVIAEKEMDIPITTTTIEDVGPISEYEIEQKPVVYVSNNILYTPTSGQTDGQKCDNMMN